jgi:hypothetical protein
VDWTWHAIAQAKAAISRAMAVVTRFAFLPAATRRRKRAHSRSCAFQAIARTPFRYFVQASLDQARDPRRKAVAPRSLDQHPACAAVAGPGSGPGQALGDAATLDLGTARVFGRHQAQPGHELPGIDKDSGGKTENDLVGAELTFRVLPGFLGGVSLKQMGLWSFNGIDDGLTGRSVASLDFAPDLGIFRPTLAVNGGGVYGKGVQDGFVVGPELRFDVAPFGGFNFGIKAAYDYQFRNAGWDEGILWAGLDLGIRF